MMSVYIAGAVAEIDRAEHWAERLRDADVIVELGYALAWPLGVPRVRPVVSGVDLRESVFSRLCTTFPDDADAFAWIVSALRAIEAWLREGGAL